MSDEKNAMDRREAIKGLVVIAGTVAAEPLLETPGLAQNAHSHAGHAAPAPTPATPAAYKPVFFNEHQYKTVDVVSELIIPTTNTPGASKAGVAAYIDTMVNEDRKLQDAYRQGLAWLDRTAKAKFKADFINLKPEQQTAILTAISSPKSKGSDGKGSSDKVGVDFFKTIKNMTIDGYYTSKIGLIEELEYKGNDYLTEFPGCTHPEHKA